jgi:hypothetical protein
VVLLVHDSFSDERIESVVFRHFHAASPTFVTSSCGWDEIERMLHMVVVSGGWSCVVGALYVVICTRRGCGVVFAFVALSFAFICHCVCLHQACNIAIIRIKEIEIILTFI